MSQNSRLHRTPYSVTNKGGYCDTPLARPPKRPDTSKEPPYLLHDSAVMLFPYASRSVTVALVGVTLRPWCDTARSARDGQKTKLQAAMVAAFLGLERGFPNVHIGLLVNAIQMHEHGPLFHPKHTTLRQYAPAAHAKAVPLEGFYGRRDPILLVRHDLLCVVPKWVLGALAARLVYRDCPVSVNGEPGPRPTHDGL